LIKGGVKVTQQEWEALEEDINKLRLDSITVRKAKRSLRLPTKGKYASKTCVLLRGKNVCQVYDKRPEDCRRFPILVIEGQRKVTFVVSSFCPRAEHLAVHLKRDLPDWAKKLTKDRRYEVVLT
jgi:Fe-S-cluster containining protein